MIGRGRRTWRAAAALLLLLAGVSRGEPVRASAASAGSGPPERVADPVPAPDAAAADLADADSHYVRRDAGHVGSRADPREIVEAISGYERAAARDAESAEVRWKLARALYFFGTDTGADDSTRRTSYDRARRAGEDAIAIIARRRSPGARPRELDPARAAALVRGDRDAAPAWFWTAVAWGEWALASGRVEAARRGAATRIRDDSATLIRIDPLFEEGGGHRILGRLHDQAPKIPFITGWVSRDEAIRNLRMAVEIAPSNLVNLHFLAEALAHRGELAEAARIEARVADAVPSARHLVEELAIQESARRNLATWKR